MLDHQTAVALSLLPGRARFQVVERLRGLRRSAPRSETHPRPEGLDRLLPALFPEATNLQSWTSRLASRACRVMAHGARAGLTLVAWGHDDYPSPLDEVANPPVALWVRGDLRALRAAPRVAIVGSRAGSTSALHIARHMARELAAAGVVVVSGLARGVDGAAHEGALETGRTLAVVGCGADVDYPPEHARLAARVAEAGTILSELPPGTTPHRFHFPLRNRLISGLCRGIVVVEANERSGSLITAGWGLDQGREVLVVPGDVAAGRNRGGHALIRDGARLVECAEQVLADLDLGTSGVSSRVGSGADADPVTSAMRPGEALDLDELGARTGWPAERMLDHLLEAELAGRIARAAGGRFVRLGRK